MYINGNFILKSDFEIRQIREEDENGDVDLFIPIGCRTANLLIPFINKDKMSRIQLSEVRSIVIRFNTMEENNKCSVHFLKNIDLFSHLLNFELNYMGYEIVIKQEIHNISFMLIKREG